MLMTTCEAKASLICARERESAKHDQQVVPHVTHFVKVNVFLAQANLVKELGNGNSRTNAHLHIKRPRSVCSSSQRLYEASYDLGRHTGRNGSDELAEDRQAELLSGLALHEQACGSTVRHLTCGVERAQVRCACKQSSCKGERKPTGIACVRCAVFGERRLKLGKRLRGDTSSDAVIVLN